MVRAGAELVLPVRNLRNGRAALTARLLPLLQAGRAHVTTVSSSAARFGRLEWEDLQAERRYSPVRAYNASTLANLLFGIELDRAAGTADGGSRATSHIPAPP